MLGAAFYCSLESTKRNDVAFFFFAFAVVNNQKQIDIYERNLRHEKLRKMFSTLFSLLIFGAYMCFFSIEAQRN